MRPAFGAAGPAAIASLVERDINRPTIRYFVAERAGTVVASTRLAVGQDASADGIHPIASRIGWPRAIRGALVLGLLTHRRLAGDEAYIEELAVAPKFRRQGIARALLDRCDDEARQNGKRRMILWVTEQNTGAVALYEGHGYRIARRMRTLRGRLLFRAPVALLMEKALPGTPDGA